VVAGLGSTQAQQRARNADDAQVDKQLQELRNTCSSLFFDKVARCLQSYNSKSIQAQQELADMLALCNGGGWWQEPAVVQGGVRGRREAFA